MSTNLSAENEVFKLIPPFRCGDIHCAVDNARPYFIDITLTSECLDMREARALRDWLNETLP